MKEYLIVTVNDANGRLSNMYASPIEYDGKKFLTCEALFQWLRFPNHPEVQKEIFEARSPMTAKMKARKNKDLLNRVKWDEAEEDIERMRMCLKLKIEQHPELKDDLKKTEDGIIIEDCSTRDKESARFWGCVRVDGKWRGRNVLGELLMELRGDREIQKADGLIADTSSEIIKSNELKIIEKQISDLTAVEMITQTLGQFGMFEWAQVFTQPISSIKSENFVGEPVKILATIASISDAFPIQLGDKRVTVLEINLQDRNGHEIECFRVLSQNHGKKAFAILNKQEFAIFRGTVISVIDKKNSFSKYMFLLYDIVERVTAEDLIYIDKKYPIDINEIFQKEIQGQGIFRYIKTTLVNELKIKGLDKAKELDKAIDFMIYQAFSSGKDQNASMKLHSLIIGAPGSGKKLLTNIAMILNPVGLEISAVDGKITVAGMIGNVVERNGRKISRPGSLGLASDGVICIQDFHEIDKNRRAVLESFAKVMEDGEIIDSTIAKTTHIARTSIHLDTNRYSQVNTQGNANSLDDIRIPTNVITRFDYIVNIPPDMERQWQVALEMSSGAKTLASYSIKEEEKDWIRILRRIVAYMISYSSKIELPLEVSEYKVEQLDLLKKDYEKRIQDIDSWQGLFTRLAISIDKYLKAITTTKFPLYKCEKKDVDLAINFIKPKLDFITTLKSNKLNPDSAETVRQKLIIEKFSSKEFSRKEVQEELKKIGQDVSEKTISRDLDTLVSAGKVKKVKRGTWAIQ